MQTLVGATVSQRTSWYYPGSYKLSALFLKETYMSAFHRVCVWRMCVHVYVYLGAYLYVRVNAGLCVCCMCAYVHVCLVMCLYVHMNAGLCVRVLHVCICLCVFGHMPVCTCVCWSLCMCV